MKIVIFGGGGFIGSAIADRLLQDGHQLRVFERPGIIPYRDFSPSESVEWVNGDFMSKSDVGNAIRGMEVVLHLISTTLPKNSNEDPIFDVQSNLVSSLQMLSEIVEQNIKKIIFISSGGTVYGKPAYMPIDEAHPTNPTVSYGVTKLAIEKYLMLYKSLYGVNINILRVSNPFGERQRLETAQGAIGVFLGKAMQGLPIDIWGDGEVIRDYIYISDVAEAFSQALKYQGSESIFNISSGAGLSLNNVIVEIEKVIGRSVNRNYLPGRSFDVPVNILSNELAKNELNWCPLISLENGISKTYQWMSEQVKKSHF